MPVPFSQVNIASCRGRMGDVGGLRRSLHKIDEVLETLEMDIGEDIRFRVEGDRRQPMHLRAADSRGSRPTNATSAAGSFTAASAAA